MELRFSFDARGTPGLQAGSEAGAVYGLGVLHGRYRPLQALLLGNAGTGRLAERLLPVPRLVELDRTAHRLDLPTIGRREAGRLSPLALERAQLYLQGLAKGVAEAPRGRLGFAHRALPIPDVPSLLSGFGLSAYLGLAEGQERMERALMELVQAGAETEALERLFEPHLQGWSPEAIRRLPPLPSLAPGGVSGGSNAFAVGPSRSQGGRALFAADPHLPIDQLPSLFFEVRLQAGAQYWLGATIPGLPAIAVGRNRGVAWSGTFAVADNVDHFLEHVAAGRSQERRGEAQPLRRRQAVIKRRGLPPLRFDLAETRRGRLLWPEGEGPNLSTAWCGLEGLAETFNAYLELWSADSAAAAERALLSARTLSLHFVLADRDGDVRYVQVGQIPSRSEGWSGLPPAEVSGPWAWEGRLLGADLPRGPAVDGVVASANEARPGPSGAVLSTLAQPDYRRRRLQQVLTSHRDHRLIDLGALQLDLYSPQGARLRPALLAALPAGPLAAALREWDLLAAPDSVGAHAFAIAYRAALHGLAPQLGGRRLSQLLEATELSVWGAAAFDRALADPKTWRGPQAEGLRAAMAGVAEARPGPWGEAQRFSLRHLLVGGLPMALGFDRGPFPLPGSIATVCQGNLVPAGEARVAIGPAYRFLCDLGEDRAYSALPGGIDGDPGSASYAAWLEEYRSGTLHPLLPPDQDPD